MVENLISIIIPTFNRSFFLAETIDSVIFQSHNNWECIVVDDGSSDYTAELMEFYCEKDFRIKFYSRPEERVKGANSCRNYGFEKSKGNFIQWLDDDDTLSNQKLKKQLKVLEEQNNPNIFVVCTWGFKKEKNNVPKLFNVFPDNQKLDTQGFFDCITKQRLFIPCHAYLTPRKLVENAGFWNSQLKINQDAEFFARVQLQADYLYNLDDPDCFVIYRKHQEKRISSNRNISNLESLIFGYRLIHAHLNYNKVKCSSYFKWKLGEILRLYRNEQPSILKEYEFFFLENHISLKTNTKQQLLKLLNRKIPFRFRKFF